MDRVIVVHRDEAFDHHEVGAFDVSIITRDGKARTLSLTMKEARSLWAKLCEIFEE